MDASRLKTSCSQFITILEFMEQNGDLLRPLACADGKQSTQRKWQELADLLNCDGSGSSRSPKLWKKVWSDWKTKVKKRASELRQAQQRTGGGPPTKKPLNDLEKRVVQIIGVSAVFGQSDLQERGFSVQQHNSPVVVPPQPPLSPPPQSSTQPPPSTRPPYSPPQTYSPALFIPEAGPSVDIGQEVGHVDHNYTIQDSTAAITGRTQRRPTPFQVAASEFRSIEVQRLRFEEHREVQLMDYLNKQIESERRRDAEFHERETERLRIQSDRLEVDRETNNILKSLSDIVQKLIEKI